MFCHIFWANRIEIAFQSHHHPHHHHHHHHHHHPQDIYPISFPSTMDPHGVEAHPLGHLDVNLPAEPTLATNARHRHVANALDGAPQLDGSHSSRCRPAAGRKAGHRDHDRSWCNIYLFIYIYGTWRNLLFFPVCFCGYKFVRCDLRLCTSNEFDATLIEETLWQGWYHHIGLDPERREGEHALANGKHINR